MKDNILLSSGFYCCTVRNICSAFEDKLLLLSDLAEDLLFSFCVLHFHYILSLCGFRFAYPDWDSYNFVNTWSDAFYWSLKILIWSLWMMPLPIFSSHSATVIKLILTLNYLSSTLIHLSFEFFITLALHVAIWKISSELSFRWLFLCSSWTNSLLNSYIDLFSIIIYIFLSSIWLFFKSA